MLIYIKDEILEFENDPSLTEKIVASINENLEKKNLQFSYLIIDETPIYDDCFSYIQKHIDSIKKVEVVAQTLKEIVDETIDSTYDYVKTAIPLISALADAFYQQPDSEAWLKLNDLFVGLQWIIETIAKIDAIRNLDEIIASHIDWNEYVQEAAKLNAIILELETAVVAKDNVSTGDILMYEIGPVFERISSKLPFLLSKEEVDSVS